MRLDLNIVDGIDLLQPLKILVDFFVLLPNQGLLLGLLNRAVCLRIVALAKFPILLLVEEPKLVQLLRYVNFELFVYQRDIVCDFYHIIGKYFFYESIAAVLFVRCRLLADHPGCMSHIVWVHWLGQLQVIVALTRLIRLLSFLLDLLEELLEFFRLIGFLESGESLAHFLHVLLELGHLLIRVL